MRSMGGCITWSVPKQCAIVWAARLWTGIAFLNRVILWSMSNILIVHFGELVASFSNKFELIHMFPYLGVLGVDLHGYFFLKTKFLYKSHHTKLPQKLKASFVRPFHLFRNYNRMYFCRLLKRWISTRALKNNHGQSWSIVVLVVKVINNGILETFGREINANSELS